LLNSHKEDRINSRRYYNKKEEEIEALDLDPITQLATLDFRNKRPNKRIREK
jgi:hypothetical protein